MQIRPNILLIVLDQLRYDCVGYAKKYNVKTPNIDKLAEDGVWFNNAYTPIPLCCPARMALLNGRRPEAFGAHWNYGGTLEVQSLAPTEYTWVRDLKRIGYSTSYLGKWHVNPNYDATHYGYDMCIHDESWEAFRRNKYPEITPKNGYWGEVDPIPLEHSRTHWFANKVIHEIEKYHDSEVAWHIRFDLTDPHLPCRPNQEFAELYSPEDIVKWDGFDETFELKPYIQKQQIYNWGAENMTWEDWSKTVALYYANITQLDHAIGLVIEKLKQTGMYDNTVIILTADHGDMCGSHKMMDKHYIMYEDVIKVPMIIKMQGSENAGKTIDNYVMNCLDIAPTILDIVKIPKKDFFHGRSIIPLIEGETCEDWRNEAVITYNGQQFGLYTQRAIVSGEWKFVWNTTDIDELYNIKEDTGELRNRIYDAKLKDLISDLRKRLYYTLLEEGDGLVLSTWLKGQLLNNKKL